MNFFLKAHTRCGTIAALGFPLEPVPSSEPGGTANVNNSPLLDSAANVPSELVIFSMLALLIECGGRYAAISDGNACAGKFTLKCPSFHRQMTSCVCRRQAIAVSCGRLDKLEGDRGVFVQ